MGSVRKRYSYKVTVPGEEPRWFDSEKPALKAAKATGGKVTRSDTYSWQVRWRTPEGKTRSKVKPTKAEADKFLVSVEHKKLTGEYVDPSAGKVTFETYAEQWRTAQVQHRSSTRTTVESHLRNHVYPTFGARPIGSIRPSELQAWVKDRAGVLAPSTVETVYRYIVSIMRAAVDDRVLTRNPCLRIKLPEIERGQVEPLDVAHIEALVDAIEDRYKALVMLAAGTGMRQGECLGLTVDRCNFFARTIKVDRQLVLESGQPIRFGPPKTPSSIRTIPMPDVVKDALAAHLKKYPAGPDGHVFTTALHLPVRRTALHESWLAAVATVAKDKDMKLPKRTRFHDLRHFYASLLIRHGESVKVVQARLGHASAAETLDTYSHLWPDSEDLTRAAVDSVLGSSRVQAVSNGVVR